MTVSLQSSAFLEAIEKHEPSSIAVVENDTGGSFSYNSLLHRITRAKELLLLKTGNSDRHFRRADCFHVTLLAILASNAIAVPLAPSCPVPELRYILDNSEALVLISSSKFTAKASEVLDDGLTKPPLYYQFDGTWPAPTDDKEVTLYDFSDELSGGMMLFTSGTTARPKGVVLSLANLTAQASSLLEAWQYAPSDRLLHVLPLHHNHGTVNALLTPLLAGSSIEFMYPFNVSSVWTRLAAPFLQTPGMNGIHKAAGDAKYVTQMHIAFFTAVPTIWSRLLRTYELLSPEMQKPCRQAISPGYLRPGISGSAALPKPIRDGWAELSGGNLLLERYGMTEVGMALSCGLEEVDRVDGCVGWPFPSVEARLMETDDDTGSQVVISLGVETDLDSGRERVREIQLRGPTVFKGYWRNDEATAKEFTTDEWFKTGDIAVRCRVPGSGLGKSGSWAQGPAYFIRGRRSVDIIKTGGEKVEECAVVGLASEAWDHKVAAVIALSENSPSESEPISLRYLRDSLKSRLTAYKIPQDMEIVDMLPRNAMGEVNKKELIASVFGGIEGIRRRSFSLGKGRVSSAATTTT
ncbi:Malonyl-CoA synthetase MCS [Aspergillus affinis]|uniref:Malonyl-CoA synthetase MCS n=1 Tax=Aspergillus affinis TaxID=1070780 RepID=UPI0022FF2ACE|nr:Malonyl-CoA synthetase MCS [Aspergillus affinis]KAI9039903.1 Malonyl-CoA synthetase MCS [Aspergillus affinis]